MMLTTLLCDYYKLGHVDQYPPGITQIFSNWTPRYTKRPNADSATHRVTHFGLQYFIKDYLQRRFSEGFFLRPKSDVIAEYVRVVRGTLGIQSPRTSHLEELHDLGYIPLAIYSIPEGFSTRCGIPSMVITNTAPSAFWLPNFIETMLSMVLWKGSTSATTAARFRRIGTKYAKQFGHTDLSFLDWQFHDFSMRGMSGLEDAVLSGMGHLTSFSGTDTIPAILAAEQYYAAGLCGGSVPACYDDQTEILTEHGFKFFADLSEGEKVAQYHTDGSIDFIVPTESYICPYDGDMISFSKPGYRYIDMVVTPNHRMVKKRKDNSLMFFEAGAYGTENCNYTHRNAVVVAGRGIGSGSAKSLSPVDRLRIAFQADGSFASHRADYTGEITGCLPIRFSFKKDRKFDRLTSILTACGFEYSSDKYADGYYSFWIKTPLGSNFRKDLSWVDLTNVSSEWAQEFVEELSHWDGHRSSKNTISYSTSILECAEVAQVVGILGNYKTQWCAYTDPRGDREVNYNVIFSLNRNSVSGEDTIKNSVPYSGLVYCVSVPTKMLVVRRNHVVAISGNTEHSVVCAGGQAGEFETFRRLIEDVYPAGVVSLVSDTWDLWKVLTDFIPRLRDSILARQGKIVIRPDSGDPVKIMIGDPDVICKPAQAGVLSLLAAALGTTNGLINNAGAIYGDSINEARAEAILAGCVAKGLSPFNAVFGVGSFTYEFQTRDTDGFAMKATAVVQNGKLIPIYKDPVTDDGGKKSLCGIPAVYRTEESTETNPDYFVTDGCGMSALDNCAFEKVYENGKLLIETDFATVRKRARAWEQEGV